RSVPDPGRCPSRARAARRRAGASLCRASRGGKGRPERPAGDAVAAGHRAGRDRPGTIRVRPQARRRGARGRRAGALPGRAPERGPRALLRHGRRRHHGGRVLRGPGADAHGSVCPRGRRDWHARRRHPGRDRGRPERLSPRDPGSRRASEPNPRDPRSAGARPADGRVRACEDGARVLARGVRGGAGLRLPERVRPAPGRDCAGPADRGRAMTEVWARHAAADPARPLRVAVVTRARDALSLTHARDAIVRELAELGVAPIAVPARGGPPVGCDLLWDPALAGTRGPRHLCAAAAGLPVVVTAHGAAAWVLPWHEVWRSRAAALWGRLRRRRALQDWHRAMPRLDAVVGVSDFGRREIGRVFRVPPGRLHRIYPGVAAIPFRREGPAIRVGRPYLLYVAQYRPKNNLETVLAAYAQVPRERRPELVAIVP